MIGWQIKAIIIAVVLAALGGLFWHDRHVTAQLDERTAELKTAAATLKIEREAYKHERAIAKAASDGYQADLRRLESERLEPFPVVRMCRQPSPPTMPTSGSATTGADAARAANDVEAAQADIGPDIGPSLKEYGIQCEANALQLTRLQEWVLAR